MADPDFTGSAQQPPYLISPRWPAPSNIVVVATTRAGGTSVAPFDSFNMALHVGDSERAVLSNRQQLLIQCSGLERIQWLEQIHGTEVVTASAAAATNTPTATPMADACYTQAPGLACAVMTADCLPVVFCDRAGREVAAAHAGWRGLLNGVLEATVARFGAAPEQLLAWIGPAIGQRHFEVDAQLRRAFLDAACAADQDDTNSAFSPNPLRDGHYFADLATLARIRLRTAGLSQCYGGELCSFQHEARFFSYRRQPETGRMATLIYRLPD